MAISLKGFVVCNIFPSCFKVAFKVDQISTVFQIIKEEAITLKNSGGMEITVGRFTAKNGITLIMNHSKPSHSPF